MESTITIIADKAEMIRFFDSNSVCSVRFFEANGDGSFRAIIRHAELGHHLSGTFTIPQIIKKLKAGGKATV